jgi:hypothetical protein
LIIQEALMILRNSFAAAAIAATLAGSSAVHAADQSRAGEIQADRYQADEFLGLDLSRAVLSPKPLGPPATFMPGPLDMTVDRESHRAHADAEPTPAPNAAVPNTAPPSAALHGAHAHHPHAAPARHLRQAAPPRLMARTKFAHHHNDPLEAQASDSRIQVWPCKSGGICNWKR